MKSQVGHKEVLTRQVFESSDVTNVTKVNVGVKVLDWPDELLTQNVVG